MVATATAAVPAGAQIYRWADERGAINYTSVPPGAGIRVTRLEAGDSSIRPLPAPARVSGPMLPALPPPPPPAPSGPPGNVDRATIEALGLALAARSRCSTDHSSRCVEARAATSATGPAYRIVRGVPATAALRAP
jgi:hypothetical protein